jgi:hypothetical protein
MTPYYMATTKFDPTSQGWDAYANWRKLPQLVEVVTIEDHYMPLRNQMTAEDWASVAPASEVGQPLCFTNLDRLQQAIARMSPTVPLNLLCVFREPTQSPIAPRSSFTFLGYDLIDDKRSVSAVTNCGDQFSAVINNAEINAHGLIKTFERAKEIQRELRRVYPGDPHANCSLWAIFRVSG